MTTWGAACALKNSYASARESVAQELEAAPAGAKVVLSSAYLYEADRHTNVISIHEDYAPTRAEGEDYVKALRRLRPAMMMLTQFDYYRRYQTVLAELQATGGAKISLTNFARVPAPDGFPHLQRVLQHVSWAPVVVNLRWE